MYVWVRHSWSFDDHKIEGVFATPEAGMHGNPSLWRKDDEGNYTRMDTPADDMPYIGEALDRFTVQGFGEYLLPEFPLDGKTLVFDILTGELWATDNPRLRITER